MNTKQLKSGRPSDRMATSGKSQAARGTSGAGIRLGDYNRLTMVKEARRADSHAFREEETFGIYLDGGDEGEILMPKTPLMRFSDILDDAARSCESAVDIVQARIPAKMSPATSAIAIPCSLI